MRNLTRISLVVALVLAFGFPAGFGGDNQGKDKQLTPEGTWLVKAVALPGILDFKLQWLQAFNKDGRTTFLLPTGGPPEYLDTDDPRIGCMGEWEKRARSGGMVFDVTQLCLLTQEWVTSPDSNVFPLNLQEIQIKLTLHPEGNAWSGDFVITTFDSDGNFLGAADGIMDATRIEMNPLP